MNIKILFASVILMAFTVLRSPAQLTQVPSPAPQQQAPSAFQITVNMLGQVNNPARITLPIEATLLDALAAVGGLTKIANPSKIILIHRSTGKEPDSVKIDLKPMLMGVTRATRLRDGDTVVVGEAIF